MTVDRHTGGFSGWHARGTQQSPEPAIRHQARTFKPFCASAISHCVEGNINVLKACLVEIVCHLAKSGILGCIVMSVLWTSIPVASQISPGPLSRAHEEISGLSGCMSCHQLSAGKPTFSCLSCHEEISWRIVARKGLHASYDLKPGSSQGCIDCHSEHNGENFKLTTWDLKTFDHGKTGYTLEGKHLGPECSHCHTPERISPRERPTIKIKDLRQTFLGLSPLCANCHQDRHQGRLGPQCLQCHNYDRWATIDKFDHSLTRYPLSGLHATVACRQCHTPGPDKLPRYAGISFRNCSDCHADPHRGRFPQSCQSCHSTAGWNRTSLPEMNRTLDHSKTTFPLLGKHSEVECIRCHAGADFNKPLAFQKCTDCHRTDPHGGQFAKRVGGVECSTCHSVNGFKPSAFGIEQHAATSYPLQGKHAGLSCAQCHIPKGTITVYAIKFRYCTDCHADEHAGQFASAPHFNRCDDCHNVEKFRPSTFGLRRHNQTKFFLTGSHQAVPCLDCHKSSPNFKPKPTAQYRWPSLACTSCHADPHDGRFNSLMRGTDSSGTAARCETCHSTQMWSDLSGFDHSKTAFSLSGAHKSTKCASCHKPPNLTTGLLRVDFKAAPTRCEACHADVHGLQFTKNGVTECARCHDAARWKPSLFDHDKQASFALTGAHRKVRCETCHTSTRTVERRNVLFYKPTPRECVACHGREMLRQSGAVN